MSGCRELYEYRDMIRNLVKRELRGRYQRSVLGMLWTLLNPLFQIAIYTLVFTVIFPSSIPNYFAYLTSGIVPWTFFSEALGQGAGCVVAGADMTKKIYFPREVLPIASVTAKFINMLLAFIIVFAFMIAGGVGIEWRVIWLLPMVMIAEYLIALGLTLIFSAVTVFLRDMEYIVGVFLMAWIWATPIMYSLDNLSTQIVSLLKINPMTLVVMCYHDVLYYHCLPSATTLLVLCLESAVLMILGKIVFSRLSNSFAEEL